MLIGGLIKFSLIDYPEKLAAVIFTLGCNFRCAYCHNPELVLPEKFNPPIKEEEVFSYLERRRGQLEGVVITGGEPTLQKDIVSFIIKIRNLGYKVKLDTNGSNPAVLRNLLKLKLLDFIAMDVKAPLDKYGLFSDEEDMPLKIKESIDIIVQSNVSYQFRTTVDRSILTPDDIVRISLMLESYKYVFQEFVQRDNLLGLAVSKQHPARAF